MLPALLLSLPTPVFRLTLAGGAEERGRAAAFRLRPGTAVVAVPGGTGYRMVDVSENRPWGSAPSAGFGQSGPGIGGFAPTPSDGGIVLGDRPSLRLTRSLSLAAWVRLDGFLTFSPGAQIVFRGDDRLGLDPYHLTVLPDGRFAFAVEDARGGSAAVYGPATLGRWVHVLGTLDDATGAMRFYVDGRETDRTTTRIRPFGRLDPNAAPGVGIGNVQNLAGPHHQPLNGTIADVAIYDRAVTPTEVEVRPAVWQVAGDRKRR